MHSIRGRVKRWAAHPSLISPSTRVLVVIHVSDIHTFCSKFTALFTSSIMFVATEFRCTFNKFYVGLYRQSGRVNYVHAARLRFACWVEISRACPCRIFHWGQDRRDEGRHRGRSYWEGAATPSPPAKGSVGALRAPQRGAGRNTDRPKVFHYFQHSGWPIPTL